MTDLEHRPLTIHKDGLIFKVTCLCGEAFTGEALLFAWEKGAKHAGMELR